MVEASATFTGTRCWMEFKVFPGERTSIDDPLQAILLTLSGDGKIAEVEGERKPIIEKIISKVQDLVDYRRAFLLEVEEAQKNYLKAHPNLEDIEEQVAMVGLELLQKQPTFTIPDLQVTWKDKYGSRLSDGTLTARLRDLTNPNITFPPVFKRLEVGVYTRYKK